MSTQPLRNSVAAKSARAAAVTPCAPRVPPPAAKVVAARLAGVTTADMPWLSKDVDLTPPDGGPESVGPAVYTPPSDRTGP